MTHHEIKTLPDGTRLYSNGTKYKPVPLSERKYKKHNPEVPGAVRWYGTLWLLPLDVLPDAERVLPETRPDSDAYDHMIKGRKCRCVPCQRPQAKYWQDKWRKERGLL